MWEEYEITPNNALQYRKEEMNDRHVMKQQIHKLKDEIRALGSVNVNAIEDYKELLERHTFLSGQYNDLLEAEKTLEQIIQELDEACGSSSAKNSERSRKNLIKPSKNCSAEAGELWNLRKTRISLRQGSGSFPSARKKLQNMMQLSGGEKHLIQPVSTFFLLFQI